MDKVELIWCAELAMHRGPVDGVTLLNVEASCSVTNEDEPVMVNQVELQDAVLDFVVAGTGGERNQFEFVSFTWSQMPYVDASELPPPPPGVAYGND